MPSILDLSNAATNILHFCKLHKTKYFELFSLEIYDIMKLLYVIIYENQTKSTIQRKIV